MGFSSMQPKDPESTKSEKQSWVDIEKFVQLGILLPAATFIGWLLGTLLDKWLGTSWLYLVGLLLGIAAGFVQLVRVAMRESSKQ